MIRKANLNDINKIMAIIKTTVEEMKTYNNTQWDENYPQDIHFISDIENEDLYVDEVDEELRGFICVNYVEPKEYEQLKWASKERAMVVHRMAVNSDFRQQGVGTNLMKFADQLALENNISYLKTDTYSINTKMNSLFKKCGYKFIGEMSFLGKEEPFYCYEKTVEILV